MTMLERIARAIAAAEGYDVDELAAYAASSSVGRKDYDKLLKKAGAVLIALREPTDGMKAAWHRDFDNWLDHKIEGEYHMWQTMIDAALEEGKDM